MTVSVLVMTYNHAPYIRQALDSVLMQQTDFDYEILISEDCSTDGTRAIVEEYRTRHPHVIRLLLSEHNIRSNEVVVRGIEAARGKYVALLDGDDYWIANDKLQKQVDFLDNHPECALCFHNARVIDEEGKRDAWNWTPANRGTISTLEELWLGNFIATCSTMFRRGLIDPIPSWYTAFFPITDWPLHILNAEHGKIGYINEVMGIYRHHKGGYYSSLHRQEKLEKTLDFYQRMNVCLDYRYDHLVQAAISKYFIEWVDEYLRQGDTKAARVCYSTYLKARPVNEYISLKRMVSTALRVYIPMRMLPPGIRRRRGLRKKQTTAD